MVDTKHPEGDDFKPSTAKPKEGLDPKAFKERYTEEAKSEPWEQLADACDNLADVIDLHLRDSKKSARSIVPKGDSKAYAKLDNKLRKALNRLQPFVGKWIRGEEVRDDEE